MAEGVCYGRTDLGLAEDAAAVAARLRPHLPADAPVFSSPLRRCRELAGALHPAPRCDERLLEMHFGEWEMRTWEAIGRAALDGWAADPLGFAPPGGESAADLMARAEAFCRDAPDTAVLVIHAGVMKAICGLLEGLPAREWMRLSFDFGSVTLVEDGRRVWHNAGHV